MPLVRNGSLYYRPLMGIRSVVARSVYPVQTKMWLLTSRAVGRAIRSKPAPSPTARGDRWVDFDQLGVPFSYEKTFDFPGEYLDAEHRRIGAAPSRTDITFLIDLGIEGYLLHADALKVYELGRLCDGDVLELGTHKGLSTSIIAAALHNRGAGELETVDIDPDASVVARGAVEQRPGAERVKFKVMDATERVEQLVRSERRFGFIFVDHWHGYEATFQVARQLRSLLNPGGFVLFHDFLDPGNAQQGHPYGVYPAVIDTIAVDPAFEFYGNFGCCGLFRKRASGSAGALDNTSQFFHKPLYLCRGAAATLFKPSAR